MSDADDSDVTARDIAGVAERAPMLLAVVDKAAVMHWCNAGWSDFSGRVRADVCGDGWFELIAARDRRRLHTLIARNEAFEVDLRMRRYDGRERWMATHGAPREDGMTILAAVDVTPAREYQHALQLLSAIGDELNVSLAIDETLEGVGRLVVGDLADMCTIAARGDDGRVMRVAIAHVDKAIEMKLWNALEEPVDLEGPSAIAQVMRTGTLLYRPIVDAPGPDEPWPALPDGLVPMTSRSLISVPLRTRDDIAGAFTVVSWSHIYTPDEVELVQEIARRCASAVDNGALYRRSEDARARLALIASLGEALAGASDVDMMVQTLVRRVVPVFADAASVSLVDDDGTHLRRHAFCHVDPDIEQRFLDGPYHAPIALDSSDPIARAARSAMPVLIEEYASHTTRNRGRAQAFEDAVRMIEPTSLLAIPLVLRQQAIGVMTLAFTGSGRAYSASDLPVVLDVARRGALAIERARSMAEERHIAEVLQHSMLPEVLPEIPGISLCASYLPGGKVDIGGDWYDVVALSRSRYGVAIGDVAGHGLRAASVMGQLRHALRAFAADGGDPASVIRRLNRFMFEQGPLDMATLIYGVLDPLQGRLDLAMAAHVPPFLLRPGEPVELLDILPAPPIGADPMTHYMNTTIELEPGATLLLYTDGLIERRSERLDDGFRRLGAALADAPPKLDEMCSFLLDRCIGADRPTDDVALLAMRYLGPTRGHFRLKRPARAEELAPVRRILSSWLESSGFGADDIAPIAVATTEAATNAIEHAYGLADGWFEVEADIDGAGVLEMTVRDTGRWRPKSRGGGGRGLTLIGRLMDDFEIRRRPVGTEIWMRRGPRRER